MDGRWMDREPRPRGGCWSWWDGVAGASAVEVRFAGRRVAGGAEPRGRAEKLRSLLPPGVEGAWLRQLHSATVLAARAGENGPGDALVTDRRGLAVAVVTADCVPILLAVRGGPSAGRIAAVHAGWRGLAGRILPAALERLDADGGDVIAWIGPAIGPCCYEVGPEVAAEVAAAVSGTPVSRPGPRGRPHLDLVAAATAQLREHGVDEPRVVGACTRCRGDRLWSYRRHGADAGRNLAVIWAGRRGPTASSPAGC